MRLAGHIARREYCCRAYQCQRASTYGPSPIINASTTAPVEILIPASCAKESVNMTGIEPATATAAAGKLPGVAGLDGTNKYDSEGDNGQSGDGGKNGADKATCDARNETSETAKRKQTAETATNGADDGILGPPGGSQGSEQGMTGETNGTTQAGKVTPKADEREEGLDGGMKRAKNMMNAVEASETAAALKAAGKPVSCQEHSREGMIYLGPR